MSLDKAARRAEQRREDEGEDKTNIRLKAPYEIDMPPTKKANPSEKAGPDRDILNIATSGESAPAEEAPLFRPPAQS